MKPFRVYKCVTENGVVKIKSVLAHRQGQGYKLLETNKSFGYSYYASENEVFKSEAEAKEAFKQSRRDTIARCERELVDVCLVGGGVTLILRI